MACLNSIFELAEQGQTRMLLENVQYQLDGICTQNVTVSRRRLCLWRLCEICCSDIQNVVKLRSLSQSRDLLRLPVLMLSEKDDVCLILLVLLALTLMRSHDGSICNFQELPEFSFRALCSQAIRTLNSYAYNLGSINSSTSNDGSLGNSLGLGVEECQVSPLNELDTNVSSSVMQSKRKFRRKPAPIRDEIVDKVECSGESSSKSDIWQTVPNDVNSVIDSLYKLYPELMCLILGNAGACHVSSNQYFGGFLALAVLNRVLVSKVESTIESDSHQYTTPACSSAGVSVIAEYQHVMCSETKVKVLDDDKNREIFTEDKLCFLQYFQNIFSSIIKMCIPQATTNVAYKGAQLNSFALWNLTSLFECTCFRNVKYRYLLVSARDNEVSLPVHVLTLLKSLTTAVLKNVADEFECLLTLTMHDDSIPKQSNLELSSLHSLFPELVTVTEADNGTHLRVRERDIWVNCLKLLVNLSSHQSADLTWAFQNDGAGVTLIVSILYFFVSYRCAFGYAQVAKEMTSGTQKGPLSLGELPLARFVYDLCLYMISLLTNLVEAVSAESLEKMLFINEESVLQICDMRDYLPPKHMDHHKHHFPRHEKDSSSLLTTLFRLLEMETSHFIDDIDSSDLHVDDFTTGVRSSGTPVADSRKSRACNSSKPHTSPDQSQSSGTLPVAELVLSGHVVLLLFSIGGANEPKSTAECRITSRLPYGTWWFPMRILKAFLSMQVHSGVVVVENIAPVVTTIRRIEQRECTSPPFPINACGLENAKKQDANLNAENSICVAEFSEPTSHVQNFLMPFSIPSSNEKRISVERDVEVHVTPHSSSYIRDPDFFTELESTSTHVGEKQPLSISMDLYASGFMEFTPQLASRRRREADSENEWMGVEPTLTKRKFGRNY